MGFDLTKEDIYQTIVEMKRNWYQIIIIPFRRWNGNSI